MKKKFSVLVNKKIHKYNKEISGKEFPDKSISHRAYILASQCLGISKINGLKSEDVKATIGALKKLGIKIIKKGDWDYVCGNGISGFKKFTGIINFSNSGTSLRSFLGILTCYPWPVTLTGDSSLRYRPVRRLTDYLERIGAFITHPKNKRFTLPVRIHGTRKWALAQKHYLKVPSAQMSNALILSAIQTKGTTEIIESSSFTRDHTQRLLKSLNADIKIEEKRGKRITKVRGQVEMKNFTINVPGDFSSAIFLIVQTLLTENSSLVIKSVCIQKNRIGAYHILKAMGAKIKFFRKRKYFNEEVADIYVKSSKLKGIKINNKKFIITAIDDLLAVWVACSLAKGKSHFSGTALLELQLKESKRITKMSENLKRFGIKTHTTKSSITIHGRSPYIKTNKFIKIPRILDHRILLSVYVLANVTGCKVLIHGFSTVDSSFPGWLKLQKNKFGSKYEIKK